MKTTLNLPDELMRTVKIRAVRENRKLQDMVADLLKRGLAYPPEGGGGTRHRVRLPLVHTSRAASPADEMTPDRVAETLLDEEVGSAS